MADAAPGYVIRRMEQQELRIALDLARAEGWNPGLHDAQAFWQADPKGHFLGLLDGRPAATISAVSYPADGAGPGFGFVGLYIVVPELRGRGLGRRLWDAALDALSAPTIGLDAVVAQQDTYRTSGFVLCGRNCRYQGQLPARGGGGPAVAGGTLPAGLLPLAEISFDEVLAYDRQCFPAGRGDFLRAWLATPGIIALGLRRGGRLAGFGAARPCGVGSKIGPLFAEDDAAAHALFHGLCQGLCQGLRQAAPPAAKAGPVFLDVSLAHAGAVRLAEAHDMKPVFETGRMYRGPAPDMDLGRVYGITSFELG